MSVRPSLSALDFAHRTPMRIGAYGLKVRDIGRVADFYRDVVGLAEYARDKDHARLGADGVTLLELEQDPALIPDDRRAAGLHHTALLMPTRRDLARWLKHAQRLGVAFKRVSDHVVTEAVYFDDPENNEVECCVDTPPDSWRWTGDDLDIPSTPLDVATLAADDDGGSPYAGAPAGLRIGHIHLRVGDVPPARRFYSGIVGFDVTCLREGVAFMSSGRYHHHFAANVWQSPGAGPREERRAGLSWFRIETNGAATFDEVAARLDASGIVATPSDRGIEVRDPWGTRVRIAAAS
jgi:catechol 2,3-dioxygenase